MARRRRRKEPSLLDLIPPVFALLALGFFFSPQFRQLLGALLYLVLFAALLAVVGLIAWAIWRFTRRSPELEEWPVQANPIAEAPLYRAASGYVNLMPLPKPVEAQWSEELLSKLEWKRFEDVVSAYVNALGLKARTTRIGADGGVDVEVLDPETGKVGSVIQCKAWDVYKVGVKPLRELFGVMAADKVPNGAFFTTGVFTAEALDWARDKNLDLVDGREFLSRIKQLTPAQQADLLAFATEGDYTTPTCPRCDVKMVERTAGKGRSEGSTFWGCRNYPRCRSTLKVAQP